MTAQPLRPYQADAVRQVLGHYRDKRRRVLLVVPTGGGKTRIAEEFCALAGGNVLFVVHRIELLQQAAARLRARFGELAVGVIAPGAAANPTAKHQVATVQTLLARGEAPAASLVIFDEAHHFVAKSWSDLAAKYPDAHVLGLTATPERQDGTPLGDIFDALVVGAKYSQLLNDGFLVSSVVYQPESEVEDDGLAQDPVAAYQKFAAGTQAFVFIRSIKGAAALAAQFNAAGIAAGTISSQSTAAERADRLDAFRAGELRVLTNDNVLTEGVDVPQASCCILAKRYSHSGGYLQAAGRVLRPYPGKEQAIIIDLTGTSLKHGLPSEDRDYSLTGKGIIRTSAPSLRTCPACFATYPAGPSKCPACGHKNPPPELKDVPIYSMALRIAYAGADTPEPAKEDEWRRLMGVVHSNGYGIIWAMEKYKKTFFSYPVELVKRDNLQHDLYRQMVERQLEKGGTENKAKGWYKSVMGVWYRRAA